MYKRYKDIFSATTYLECDSEGIPSTLKLKLCVVIILWEIAKANGEIRIEEFQEIVRQTSHEFHFMDDEASELLDTAVILEREKSRLDEFIGEVNKSFNNEQREHLFDMIIEVAKADGTFDDKEKEIALKLREKLNLKV